MKSEINLLCPVGRSSTVQFNISPGIENLSGKKAGFLDNSKFNADRYLKRIEEILIKDYGIKETIWSVKPNAWSHVSEEIEKLYECDFVVTAVGD